MSRVYVLLNPATAGWTAFRRWRRLEPVARSRFPDLVLHQTTVPDDLARIARSLAAEDALILAAGGDGTSHEVINGRLADHTHPPVGPPPGGSPGSETSIRSGRRRGLASTRCCGRIFRGSTARPGDGARLE